MENNNIAAEETEMNDVSVSNENANANGVGEATASTEGMNAVAAFLYDRFKLKQSKATIKGEIIAGLTTFFTMAYIIFVNPDILSAAGMPVVPVAIATCLAAALGTVLIGILSNYPFAQAPGMGLNAFFAYTICGSMGLPWQAGLAAVFLSGVISTVITLTKVKGMILNAIPTTLKKAIGVGIGLFIAYIGLINTGVIVPNPFVATELSKLTGAMQIMTLVGLVITIALMVLKVKGALLWGILANAALCIIVAGISVAAGDGTAAASLGISFDFQWNYSLETFGQFIYGFKDLFSHGSNFGAIIASVLSVLICLCLVDIFDTVGTLVGAAHQGGFLDEKGELPKADRALLADVIATSAGAVLGTSTVTTYVESTAGISAGGKTGLTSMVVAVLFLLSIVISPFVGMISSAATAPVLVIVGVLMISSVKDIEWTNLAEAIPAFLTIIIMPLGYSIADGIAWGFISYCIVKTTIGVAAIIRKEKTEKLFGLHPLLIAFSAMFILRYVFLALLSQGIIA